MDAAPHARPGCARTSALALVLLLAAVCSASHTPAAPAAHLVHTLHHHEILPRAHVRHLTDAAEGQPDHDEETVVMARRAVNASAANPNPNPNDNPNPTPKSNPNDDGLRRVAFAAYNRSFELELRPDTALFHRGVPVVTVLGEEGSGRRRFMVDAENYVRGHVVGVPGSVASLYMRADGGLFGHMTLPPPDTTTTTATVTDTTFFFEPAAPHYPTDDAVNAGDMLVYTADDIRADGWRKGRGASAGASFCAHQSPGEGGASQHDDHDHDHSHGHDHVTASGDIPAFPPPRRTAREAASSTYNTCLMTVVADFRFYSYYSSSVADATAAMIRHIDVADSIFRRTSFDGQTGLGLGVRAVTVLASRAADPFMSQDTWAVTDLLQAFSTEFDFSSSCLAHLFTRIDFDGGTLGLAWVASPSPTRAGGICHSSSTRWLNTGLSTNINFGSNVPFLTSALVLTHEVGHNWGAEHDSSGDAVCSPSNSNGGKYIMHPVAVSGNDENNDDFSTCSRTSMSKAVAAKGTCFSVPPAAICGNGIVEEGGDDGDTSTLSDNEECDTGGATSCCTADCKLASGATCTPENNDCCDPATCTAYARSDNILCFQSFAFDEGCRQDGFCTKASDNTPICESPLGAKPDDTVCGIGGRCVVPDVLTTDYASRCTSLCERFGALDCICDADALECRACCRDDPAATCSSDNCDCPFRTFTNGTCTPLKAILTADNVGAANTACYRDHMDDAESAFVNEPPLDPNCDPASGDTCQRVTNAASGRPCSRGACNLKGECAASSTDVARFWDGIGNLSIDDLRRWAIRNIVGAVLLAVFLLWCPISICISRYDSRMRKNNANYGTARTDAAARHADRAFVRPGRGSLDRNGQKDAAGLRVEDSTSRGGSRRGSSRRLRRASADPDSLAGGGSSGSGSGHGRGGHVHHHFHKDGRVYTAEEEERYKEKRLQRQARARAEAEARAERHRRARPLTREELLARQQQRRQAEKHATAEQAEAATLARAESRARRADREKRSHFGNMRKGEPAGASAAAGDAARGNGNNNASRANNAPNANSGARPLHIRGQHQAAVAARNREVLDAAAREGSQAARKGELL